MKKGINHLFIFGILAVQCTMTLAQYIPSSNQGFQFASMHNPSFTGVEPFNDLKFGYRYQWAGFNDDTPTFMNLIYNFRTNQPTDFKRNSLRVSSIPYSGRKVPARQLIFQGLGINIFNENVAAIKRTGGGINYAFHYPISRKRSITIASGLSLIVDNMRIDMDKIYLGLNPDPDPVYGDMLNSSPSQTNLNLRAGILVYSPDFYAGFCYLPILNANLNSFSNGFNAPSFRGTFQAGISIPLSPVIELKPGVLGILRTDNVVLIDYNLRAVLFQRVCAGVIYRNTQSLAGLINIKITDVFSAVYSYEVSANQFKHFNDGSHEIILAIRLSTFNYMDSYLW